MEKRLLKDAALCAIEFTEKYSGKDAKTKRYQALKALADLTLTDLENGKEESECNYTAYDVLDTIQGTKYSAEESKKPRANQYLKDLTKHLPSHNDMLKDIAMENGLTAIPSYDFSASPGGGSGNYSTHFITPIELDVVDIPASEKIPEGAIKYYLETIENLPTWIKWINNFELSEWRIKLMAGLMILALILGVGLYFLFMIIFLNSKSGGLEIFRSFVGTLGLCVAIFWPFRQLYLCLTMRIISAPILMQPSNITNAQIECFATEKIRESTGKPIRKLRMVSYVSTCPHPKCNSRIEVENGGKEFHHRLIGRCLEAPLEHVYSFDRVLRIGRALRSN